jgi:hypothetical protein
MPVNRDRNVEEKGYSRGKLRKYAGSGNFSQDLGTVVVPGLLEE